MDYDVSKYPAELFLRWLRLFIRGLGEYLMGESAGIGQVGSMRDLDEFD